MPENGRAARLCIRHEGGEGTYTCQPSLERGEQKAAIEC
jgi:hypothetical protein